MRTAPAALGPPTRASVESAARELLHSGSWTKADIFLFAVPGSPIVVKDFSRKVAFIRLLGRLQIARECRAYEAIQGLDGVPRWLGRVDAHALALERLDGSLLQQHRKTERRHGLLAEMRTILDAIHERGVIHNDLRGKDNAFVRSDGRLVLLDFAGAFRFQPGSFWHRLLFERLVRVDEAAYLKWKTILAPEDLTPEEARFLRRFARFRRLWVFNPKGALRQS